MNQAERALDGDDDGVEDQGAEEAFMGYVCQERIVLVGLGSRVSRMRAKWGSPITAYRQALRRSIPVASGGKKRTQTGGAERRTRTSTGYVPGSGCLPLWRSSISWAPNRDPRENAWKYELLRWLTRCRPMELSSS